MMKRGLYIHIPFCQTICSYCDFCKVYYNTSLVNDYLNELFCELNERNINNISSIYIGGGTPSSLNEEQLERLLKKVSNYYQDGMSFAIEANVENLNESKIKLLKKYHINRVSLGVQSFNLELLKIMNRNHDYYKVKEVIDLLKKYEIDDINCDLIYGLPNQDEKILLDDINTMLSLDIKHISTYALMINKNTMMHNWKINEASDEMNRKLYDLIVINLEKNGFKRYEVSNFAKEGYESKHNLLYWKNIEYYGIGVGASGYLNSIRYDNTKSINKYLDHQREVEQEILTKGDKEFYHLMLGLRLVKGINIKEFNQTYNCDLLKKYQDKLIPLLEDKLIEINDGYLKITNQNLYIMDYVLKKLLF